MNRKLYFLGFVVGFLVSFIIIVVLSSLIRKKYQKKSGNADKKVSFFYSLFCKNEYDERQLLARGKAYKAGFWTMMIYFTIKTALLEVVFEIKFSQIYADWIGIFLGILVFVVICIFKDAYLSLNENAVGASWSFFAIAVINILCGIKILKGKDPSASVINFTAAGVLLIVILMIGIKKWLDHKTEEE